MRLMSMLAGALVALALLAGGSFGAPAPKADPIPAGDYRLDPPHSSVIFRISHMGFSHFTGRMEHFDAKLRFDPAHPEKSRVEATIDPASLASDNPPAHFLAMLHGPDWLDAAKYPAITFRSTRIEVHGHDARITGDFTMHGVTHPLVLQAHFNGGYAGFAMDPHARIGFSAHGTIKRSQYGISMGLPPPGSFMGVGDDVDVAIETEFNGPAWHQH